MTGPGSALLVLLLAGCAQEGDPNGGADRQPHPEPSRIASEELDPMRIMSSAFEDDGTIPQRYTCDGEDVSPPLAWEDAPEGTEAFALVVHDPDAPRGDWVHWVVYDIPGHATELPEDVGPAPTLDNLGEALQGKNDFGKIGHGGPCPPPGKPHRYVFTLYALDSRLGLEPGASRGQVESAARDHVLAEAALTGRYGR